MSCPSPEAQGPHSHLSERPKTTFKPGPYKGPQRRNPELIDAEQLKAQLDSQVDEFRRNS